MCVYVHMSVQYVCMCVYECTVFVDLNSYVHMRVYVCM